jgi:DNA-nicking Smr family endonuclease
VKRGPRGLSEEDRILWHRVARTVKPMPGVELPADPAPPEASPQALSEGAVVPPAKAENEPFKPFLPPYVPPISAASPRAELDRPTHGKIAKGHLSIDARIDLHGMTQVEAHGTLLSFLHRAHAAGSRHVLVITGKGKGGDGILRRAVPEWLSTAPFRGIVGAHASAARQHGGEGALYVRLRRTDRGGA